MDAGAVEILRREALAFESVTQGLRPLVDAIGDARVVLIGEASHGTHEFYAIRAELTRLLIRERGFTIVAAEADWPDALRANRWVRGATEEIDPDAALGDFTRFPRWMWRNREIAGFLLWLHAYNASLPREKRAGFWGLDLYSLHRSIQSVLEYLDRSDPAGARRARARYACFETFGEDPQEYGYSAHLGLAPDCEKQVTAQLIELLHDHGSRHRGDKLDEHFFAEQNARLVANAEQYYRAMFGGHADSWNVRDSHMMETLEQLLEHAGPRARAVVWAHNSHLGDASATQMGWQGGHNVGQLVRRRFGDEAWLVGFTTHDGTVTAARDWGDAAERRRVRPAVDGSYERLFHDAAMKSFLLMLRGERGREAKAALAEERLERAIGVIYRPETERRSHYFRAKLPEQFDAVIHIDRTHALQPLEAWSRDEADLPETFPTGM
jgi:erythromycin esterase-like protein